MQQQAHPDFDWLFVRMPIPGTNASQVEYCPYMATAQTVRPLRLWPGLVIVILQYLARFVVPLFEPGAANFAVIGALAGALAVVVWWLFFSRAPWSERLGAILLMAAAVFATRPLLHPSIATGMMGLMFFLYAIPPALSLALVVWAVAARSLSGALRWASLAAAILVACGIWTLLRTEGVTGEGASQLSWRWSKTHEERLPAQIAAQPAAPPEAPAAAKTPDEPAPATATGKPAAPPTPPPAPVTPVLWPGFRGPARDSVLRGMRIKTDWSASPPPELWRRPVGPGWSSFAVSEDLLYTQEQRGDHEVVVCYRLTSGQPVWAHRDAARFWESNAGAGPRGTPALSNGRVYTLGATGILNALDARTGAVVWSRNAASDTGAKVPGWGFASSPLVVGDLLIVATSGRLIGYDLATGVPRWSKQTGGGSYSSPHLLALGGVPQVLLLNGAGAASFAPADGKLLWEHPWEGTPMLQPALAAGGDVLITTGDMMGGVGVRRLAVAPSSAGWTVTERWTSKGLKPYYNDLVVHNGHAFGFDGSILSCIDLADGKRKWKGGRYGHGQMVLLPDQDLLLVLSEEGELALVQAAPDKFTELARFKAIEGKTWNHPALAGDVLLVRNGEEMAAFRLSLESR
jgi:outer membrane protein assembly factor BamB